MHPSNAGATLSCSSDQAEKKGGNEKSNGHEVRRCEAGAQRPFKEDSHVVCLISLLHKRR
jgi:hypothetical protein